MGALLHCTAARRAKLRLFRQGHRAPLVEATRQEISSGSGRLFSNPSDGGVTSLHGSKECPFQEACRPSSRLPHRTALSSWCPLRLPSSLDCISILVAPLIHCRQQGLPISRGMQTEFTL